MNLKSQKGITIIALVITIILMLILVGVGINYGGDAIEKAKLEDIKTDMISIKTRAKIITEQYNFKDIESLVGSTISSEEIETLGLSVEDSDNIRKWNTEDLSSQKLDNIDGDKYVVFYDLENPNNCEVYYLEGYKGEHSLSSLQDE